MTLIEKPVAGQPMRAGWGAAVADRLNQLGPFGVPGMLLRDGPFGQGSAPLPRNQRDRRGAAAATESAGCFAIVAGPIEEPDEGAEIEPTIHFSNRYFQYGNLTLECGDREITSADFVSAGSSPAPIVVAVKIPCTAATRLPQASIVIHDSFEELQDDQSELEDAVIPLYLIAPDFSVVCDFRRLPTTMAGEIIGEENQS